MVPLIIICSEIVVPTFIHIHGVRLLIFCNHVWRTKAGNMDNCKRYGRCKHKLPQFAFSRNPSCPVLHNQLVREGMAHWLILSAFNNLRIHLIITCQVRSSQSVAFHHKGVCALQHHSNAELPPLRSDGCHSHCALPSLSQPLAFFCLHRRVITQPLDNRSC